MGDARSLPAAQQARPKSYVIESFERIKARSGGLARTIDHVTADGDRVAVESHNEVGNHGFQVFDSGANIAEPNSMPGRFGNAL